MGLQSHDYFTEVAKPVFKNKTTTKKTITILHSNLKNLLFFSIVQEHFKLFLELNRRVHNI